MKRPAKRRPGAKVGGVTLVELLVVIAIMVILMAIMASALGAFTHTTRVNGAAETVASVFREARFYAMTRNVPVVPVILRDRKGKFSVTYAAKVLNFRGSLLDSAAAPITYAPAVSGTTASNWTMYRQSLDGATLYETDPARNHGFFTYMVGAPTLKLADVGNAGVKQAFYELLYMVVRPPSNDRNSPLVNDSTQYTYEIRARGVHNTKPGQYTPTTTNFGGADGYVVIGATGIEETMASAADAREYIIPGTQLPDHVAIDQVPDVSASDGPVACTTTAQAGKFWEDNLTAVAGGAQLKPDYYPLFLPIFLPDGTVGAGVGRNALGGMEASRQAKWSRWRNQTLRILDTITREVRYVSIGLGGGGSVGGSGSGQVSISENIPVDPSSPTSTSDPDYREDDMPSYNDVYDPSSSSASSTSNSSSTASSSTTSASSSSTSSNSTSNNSTTNSSNSTGTGSTASTSNSASNSAASTANSASNSSTSNSTSTSNSSSSSTGTGSTSSQSSTSNSSSTSSSNSSSSNSSTSTTSGAGGPTTSSGSSGASSGGQF